jgi:hypothetical protein
MARLLFWLFLLFLSGCTLVDKHADIPPAPPQEVAGPPLPPPAEPEVLVLLPRPAEPSPVLPEPVPPPKASKGTKTLAEPSPAQVILEAQKEARVAPTKRGYFGGSGQQRYLWMPGKIYDIYLTPGTGTKLELPPGETLAHHLMLNPKSFDLAMATVGDEGAQNTIILLRPCTPGEGDGEAKCVPSAEVDVAMTSTSGRSYPLHLIIGKVGMVSVTWEVTPVPHVQPLEPRRQP